MRKIFSVSELTGYLKNLLESDFLLSNLWVRGEISNFKHHTSGHMYFTIKDEISSLKCVMFRSKNLQMGFTPANGMRVIARGWLSLYDRDGVYQLYVEELQPDGIGALHLAFAQLKEKLQREGLFDQERKRPLPFLPGKIGIVTSPTGAALQDMLTIIFRRFPKARVVIAPAMVQGEEAPGQIAAALYRLNQQAEPDVIILGRGGGSIEELWAFNTEVVARAVYQSRAPVVSAVGHETDFTIADFVADVRAATPSAAAELVVPEYDDLTARIAGLEYRLRQGLRLLLRDKQRQLERLVSARIFSRPEQLLLTKKQLVDRLEEKLIKETKRFVKEREYQLTVLSRRLAALNPLAVLTRGFTIMTDQSGQIIQRTGEVHQNQEVKVLLADGTVVCKVLAVKEETWWDKTK